MGILVSDCNYSEVRVDEHDSGPVASVHKGVPLVHQHPRGYRCIWPTTSPLVCLMCIHGYYH